MAARLPEDIEAEWLDATREWELAGATRRLWEADSSLWTGADEGNWLGWLEPGGGFDLMDAGVVANELTDEGKPETRCFLMSGFSAAHVEARAGGVGALEILTKPFNPEALSQRISAAGHRAR